MKKILIIGTIDKTHTKISGQYDRTEIIKNGLENEGYLVNFVNMMNWKKKPLSLFINIVSGYYRCDTIIFLASLNGTRVILNILTCLSAIKRKPVFQIAVGGRSNFEFVKNSKWYRNKVKEICAVFVEVESMIEDYNSIGLKNVYYLPNCKKIVPNINVIKNAGLCEPYRFCTYSRITPEKGIEEAVNVIKELNEKYGRKYCVLDIYGTYLKEDEKWFLELMKSSTDLITFKGKIERKDSIIALSQYDLMIFPTRHIGEGVPGGMIDCYEAGVPIVTCNTSYMKKIVHDGITGFTYDAEKEEGLFNTILRYTEECDAEKKQSLRILCQSEAQKYDIDRVIRTLSNFVENVF